MWQALAAPSIFDAECEARVVAEYLGEAKGAFVEVGAFQPIGLSQTYHLEQAGWSGVLVEPVSEHAAALRRVRNARVFEVACGSPENHGRRAPMRVAGGLSTLRTSDLSPDLAACEVRDVSVVTLDFVLAEAGLKAVDFLSIDVEGVEIDVLRGFSIGRFRPRLMLIEDHVGTLDVHRYMQSKGYKLVRRTGLNSWYVPSDVTFPISLYGRCQLLRKYYLSLPIRHLKRLRKGLIKALGGWGLRRHRPPRPPAPARPSAGTAPGAPTARFLPR